MSKVELMELPRIFDPRGNLTFLQPSSNIPFEIKRVFWTYAVPGGGIRGGHAYKTQDEVIIALSGSFDVVIKGARGSMQKFSLNRSYKGLYLPALTWRHVENFSTNAVSLHLSDQVFSREDYVWSYEEFQNLVSGHDK